MQICVRLFVPFYGKLKSKCLMFSEANLFQTRILSISPAVTTTPSPTTARLTTRQPDRTSNSRKQNTTLPACVLAIVNCCSRYDETVRLPCFERFQCNAAFFGQKACSADIKASAFREVEKFSRK